MFPLKDENPTRTRPYLTIGLIVVNLVIFFALFLSGNLQGVATEYGMKPAEILNGQNLHTLFTSMFLHAGIFHVIGNIWFLWIFGDNIEDICGRGRFLLLYFACGLAASFAHALLNQGSMVPTVGASGAIAGVLGAYIITYPRVKVYTVMFFLFIFFPIAIPAFAFIGIWFFIQFLSGSVALVIGNVSIAYWAHIGGFLAGFLMIRFLRKEPSRSPQQDRRMFGYLEAPSRLRSWVMASLSNALSGLKSTVVGD